MLSLIKSALIDTNSNRVEKAVEDLRLNEEDEKELGEWKETVFDLIRTIRDPEKPQTLQDLDVVQEKLVSVAKAPNSNCYYVGIEFVPTVPHCSLATLIGLCIRAKLDRELPAGQFKVDLKIREGSHSTAAEITKQINDKERVAAALENPNLKRTVDNCIEEQDY